ncbi:MAG: carbon-nitrogen hydrolase [Campylobacter sp.]|nr:carbon-nitrogen hydrolase [Campylobacter sp.]
MQNLKVGIVSHKFLGSKKETVKRTVELIENVKKQGANLVVLQELHQSEYFCQDEDVSKFDYANSWSEDLEFWATIAKDNNIVLVTSLFEKRATGLYHNTAVVFEKDGSIAGKYRKMHIPDDPNFYEKFYFTPGDLGYEPIKTSVGNLGVLVCWDQWYPEAARLMALKGADVLIYPTAIGWFDSDLPDEKERQLDAWMAVQRGHAVANALPVIAVNRIGFEYAPNHESGIRFWGNSFIYGPQGEILYRQNGTQELAKVVELDMKACENVRRWWPFLRDRRIDSYGELVKRFID